MHCFAQLRADVCHAPAVHPWLLCTLHLLPMTALQAGIIPTRPREGRHLAQRHVARRAEIVPDSSNYSQLDQSGRSRAKYKCITGISS